MYKYFEIDENNLQFLNELKISEGMKTDKAAINFIISEYMKFYKSEKTSDNGKRMADEVNQKLMEEYGPFFTKMASILTSVDKSNQTILDIMNTYLSRDGIEQCIFTDIVPSPVIEKSREYHKHKLTKAKQKKDNK